MVNNHKSTNSVSTETFFAQEWLLKFLHRSSEQPLLALTTLVSQSLFFVFDAIKIPKVGVEEIR